MTTADRRDVSWFGYGKKGGREGKGESNKIFGNGKGEGVRMEREILFSPLIPVRPRLPLDFLFPFLRNNPISPADNALKAYAAP